MATAQEEFQNDPDARLTIRRVNLKLSNVKRIVLAETYKVIKTLLKVFLCVFSTTTPLTWAH